MSENTAISSTEQSPAAPTGGFAVSAIAPTQAANDETPSDTLALQIEQETRMIGQLVGNSFFGAMAEAVRGVARGVIGSPKANPKFLAEMIDRKNRVAELTAQQAANDEVQYEQAANDEVQFKQAA